MTTMPHFPCGTRLDVCSHVARNGKDAGTARRRQGGRCGRRQPPDGAASRFAPADGANAAGSEDPAAGGRERCRPGRARRSQPPPAGLSGEPGDGFSPLAAADRPGPDHRCASASPGQREAIGRSRAAAGGAVGGRPQHAGARGAARRPRADAGNCRDRARNGRAGQNRHSQAARPGLRNHHHAALRAAFEPGNRPGPRPDRARGEYALLAGGAQVDDFGHALVPSIVPLLASKKGSPSTSSGPTVGGM